jgi:SAM-dependent methyltransferase
VTAYDEVPYPSFALPQTHPDRLATIATLLGLAPAPVARCRVLELGCGDGSNLIPMAASLPASRFVGVDLAPGPIAVARTAAARLALENVTFHHIDVMQVTAALGTFDYVIAHGMYSWVPAEVRDKLLAICRQHLTPDGVAYMSYNALPGCRVRQMVREMLLFHVGRTSLPGEFAGGVAPTRQIARAVELARILVAARPSSDPFQTILRDELEEWEGTSGAYVFHDDLAPVNTPVYFTEFVQHAAAHGLQYLCEADYHETQDRRYPPDVRAALARFAGEDVCRREQYLDFLQCRRFRQTLLCHKERTVHRPPAPQLVRRLYASSVARPIEEGAPGSASGQGTSTARGRRVVEFQGPRGAAMRTDHPVAIAALEHLSDMWPQAAAFGELLRAARGRVAAEVSAVGRRGAGPAPNREAEALAEILLAAFGAGLVELHVQPPSLLARATDRPVASPVARLQSETQNGVTNLRHTTVKVEDDVGRRLLQLLDGTRDRAALRAEMAGFLRDRFRSQDGSGPMTDVPKDQSLGSTADRQAELDRALAAVPEDLEAALDRLANLALLVA